MVEKKKVFYLKERMNDPNRYIIAIDDDLRDEFYIGGLKEGSYHILQALLLNMNYPTYLRFCRDIGGAELIGKNDLYVIPVFKKTSEAIQIVDMLNAQINLVVWEKKNPDWKAHQDYLKGKN